VTYFQALIVDEVRGVYVILVTLIKKGTCTKTQTALSASGVDWPGYSMVEQ